MLRWRLLLGTLLIAGAIALAWLDHRAATPGVWLVPLGIVLVLMATKETLDFAEAAQMRPPRGAVYSGNVLLVVASWLPVYIAAAPRHGTLANGWDWTVAALAFGVLLVFLGEMKRYRAPGGSLANVAGGVFSLIYVGLMMSFAVEMRLAWGVGALAAWIIVVKCGDTGAYTVGRLVGRHKMAPFISPGKTIEGALGSLAFSCLAAWLAFHLLLPRMMPPNWHNNGPWWGWIAFGLLVGAAGMLGDLAESLLKRDIGRKDSSDWLPGFGGVLDILDSLLLSAPVAWFCWAAGLVG